MSAPRPAFTPNGGTSWLDWVLEPRHNAVLYDESDHARAELVELRKERDELRKAALGLGKLCHAGEYLESDREFMCDTDMQRHNTLVAKLRAEKETEP